MSRIILIVFFLFSLSVSAQSVRMRGLKFDESSYNALPSQAGLVKGDELPRAVSLEEYCPTVGDQGAHGTCAAFSSSYYLMAIREAIRRNKMDVATIDHFRGAPGYVYEKIKDPSDMQCQGGASLVVALATLQKYGVPLLQDFPYPNCNQPSSSLDEKAVQNRITTKLICTTQEKFTPEQKILLTKAVLANKMPIVFGLHAMPSFIAGAGDVWKPAPMEKVTENDGHALCMIGYDDDMHGGAFRLVNSWGSGWGDKGFYWLRYSDFLNYAGSAFAVLPEPLTQNAVTLQAQVDFRLRDGSPMAVRRSAANRGLEVTNDAASENRIAAFGMYTMTQPYSSGTAFKCHIDNDQPGFIYVFNSDGRSVNQLFPYAADINPVLLANNTLVLPSETKSIKLDNVPGKEQILLLFAKKAFDVSSIAKGIKLSGGSFADQILKILGSEIIPASAIKYDPNRVAFQIDGEASGSIVPLIVELDHK